MTSRLYFSNVSVEQGEEVPVGVFPADQQLVLLCRHDNYLSAKVRVEAVAGLPEETSPFNKYVHFAFAQPGYIRPVTLTVPVAVTGNLFISDDFAVPFPEYQPLLRLHDPPGGSSFAHYQAVEVATNIDISSRVSAESLQTAVSTFAVFEGELHHVAGVAFGALSALSREIVSYSTRAGGRVEHQDVQYSIASTETGALLTTTFTYTTSAEPELAGIDSDVYLMPAITVVLSRMERYTLSECTLQARQVLAWNALQDKSGFYLVTHHDIHSRVIPDLQELVAAELAKNKTGYVPAHHSEEPFNAGKLANLTQALKGWNATLHDNIALHQQASSGNLTRVDHLAPQQLINKARYLNGSRASPSARDELSAYHVLSFSGNDKFFRHSLSFFPPPPLLLLLTCIFFLLLFFFV